MEKKYCEIHHLYYTGDICPFCQSEKYERMSRKYTHKPKKEKKEDSMKQVEITEDVIEKLKKHFEK